MAWFDERDLELLCALYRNGRASNKALAGAVGLSASACFARVRALERTGLILRVSAQLAFARLGAFEAWCDVALKSDQIGFVRAFEHVAANEPEIESIHVLALPGQVRLYVVAESFEACAALVERLSARQDLVAKINIAPIFKKSEPGSGFPKRVLSGLARRLRLEQP